LAYEVFRYLFIIFRGTRKEQSDFFGLPSQADTCYYISNHSKLEEIAFRACSPRYPIPI